MPADGEYGGEDCVWRQRWIASDSVFTAGLPQSLKVIDVTVSPRCLLHCDEVLVAAESNFVAEDFVLDGGGLEVGVLEVGTDELHDIEPSVFCDEDEVAA